jgi:hypothetical protein
MGSHEFSASSTAVVRDVGLDVVAGGAWPETWSRPQGEHALIVWNNPSAAVAAAHNIDPDVDKHAITEVIDSVAPWPKPRSTDVDA